MRPKSMPSSIRLALVALSAMFILSACSSTVGGRYLVRNGNRVQWDPRRLPLPIIVDGNDGALAAATAEAAMFINAKAQIELFTPVQVWPPKGFKLPKNVIWAILVKRGEPKAKYSVGVTAIGSSVKDSRILHCSVRIRNRVGGDLLRVVMIHELLHTLGIQHSKNRKSVLYPSIESPSQALLKTDIRAIRRAYQGRR